MPPPAEEIADKLRHGQPVDDASFDAFYSADVRQASARTWTPVVAELRVAELLAEAAATKVLDVGCGPGKFCIAGALSTQLTYVGVECRAFLLDEARSLAARLQVGERARFIAADAFALDWSEFDAFYFFNPFIAYDVDGESGNNRPFAGPAARVPASLTASRLHAAASGTRVVTYHGFGGRMPPSYRLARVERYANDTLQLWIRT